MSSHIFRPHRAAVAPVWPNYTGTAHLVGASASGRVTVYVDPSLGAAGLQNATDLLKDADRVVKANDGFFGVQSGPVNVIVFALGDVTDGTGGADHASCDYMTGQNIECDASFGNSMRVSALFEAELSECSMGGNVCGQNTGEALSRWCAAAVSNNALADFATAPTWHADGMEDFVTRTDPTDQNPDSTGCGMAFISWLQSRGHKLAQIAPAMVALKDGGTFAEVYAKLTGDAAANAWPKFSAAVRALPNGVKNDDPFAGVQPPPPAPSTTPLQLAMLVLQTALDDLAAGKTETVMKADIEAVLKAH